MNGHNNSTPFPHHSLIPIIIIIIFFLANGANPSPESLIYAGCSQLRYTPATPYESNLNSLLSSLVNSAAISNFNSFKISPPGSSSNDAVYGLYQCRGDLTNSACRTCVASAVSRVGTYCIGTSGGALQLDGCFIKYDSSAFLGAQDKTVVSHKCGPPSIGYDSEMVARRDAVLGYLTEGGGQYFRVGGSGDVQGMVQCVQDLNTGECQDCVSEAVGRLKTECGSAPWGDVFLGKCYARYSGQGLSSGGGRGLWWWTAVCLVSAVAFVNKLVLF